MRYFLELSYDGTTYHGWQIQKNAITVQEVLNKSLSTLLRNNIEVMGAGRTDTGVHATMMVAHFDVEKDINGYKDFLYQLNSLLPKDVSANKIMEVKPEGHARFDAIRREYLYKIALKKDPFLINRAWTHLYPIDLNLMNEACNVLKTFNDFSCFAKSGTQTKTNICKIEEAVWYEENGIIIFRIKADRFLRNMVRAIVGTLLEIGKGEMDIEGLKKVIASNDRSQAGTSVPAHGLYLSKIEYPTNIFKK